ncbi:MAG: cell division protein FtsQ/DivIB [Nitrospirota bacterium]
MTNQRHSKRKRKKSVYVRGNRYNKCHRRNKRDKKRGIFLVFILCSWIGGYSGSWLYQWVTTSEYFKVNHIEVKGLQYSKKEEMLNLIGSKGNNIFQIDIDHIKERIEKKPWIKDVWLRKDFPDGIIVDIKERKPVALYKRGDDLYMIDEEGILLERIEKREIDLPLIIGKNLNDSMVDGVDIIKLLCYGDKVPLVIDIRDDRNMLVNLKNYRVRMGNSRYNEKIKRFLEFERVLMMEKGGDPKEIDMRFPGRVIVREM